MPEPKTKRVVRAAAPSEPSSPAVITAPAPEPALENAVPSVTIDPAEAQAAAVRGFEAIVEEMNAFTRSEIAAAADGATALLGARTLAEAVDVNLGYARRSFDVLIGSSAKLSEISAKTASDASRPILSRLGDGWKMLQVG